MNGLRDDSLVGLVWLAYSGSKTDRFAAFRTMLELNPTDEVAELCRRGLVSWTTQERTAVVEDLMQALGETVRSTVWTSH